MGVGSQSRFFFCSHGNDDSDEDDDWDEDPTEESDFNGVS